MCTLNVAHKMTQGLYHITMHIFYALVVYPQCGTDIHPITAPQPKQHDIYQLHVRNLGYKGPTEEGCVDISITEIVTFTITLYLHISTHPCWTLTHQRIYSCWTLTHQHTLVLDTYTSAHTRAGHLHISTHTCWTCTNTSAHTRARN